MKKNEFCLKIRLCLEEKRILLQNYEFPLTKFAFENYDFPFEENMNLLEKYEFS